MSGKDPLPQAQAYQGVKSTNPPNLIKSIRAPTTNDFKYPIGTLWINTVTSTSYQLVKAPGVWAILGTNTGGDIQTLTGGSGGAILPTLGNITLAGTANQIATIGAGSTITFSLIGPYTPATYTAHGVLLGEGTSSIVATTAGTNGQVLLGSTGADPAFGTITTTTGVAFTTGAGSLAIDVKNGGFAVVDQTSSSANIAIQTMYVIDNGSTLAVLTLPATAPQGSTIRVIGSSLGGWKIAQNASQQIVGVGVNTTSGTSGSLSSASKNDCVELVASVGGASTIWTIASYSGALTFV
jgi:hypothetical protein